MSTPMTPKTIESSEFKFDWAIYGDATLAGLAQLIPVPFLDSLVEDYFRNRMPMAIARHNNYAITPEAVTAVNASRWTWGGFWLKVLLWPFRLTVDLLLRFVRKIVYFLTVKKAVDALNLYWQRAFLINHLIRRGHLSDPDRLPVAVAAMEMVLAQAKESPLRRLARRLLAAPLRIAQSVWHAWRGQPDSALDETRAQMANNWGSFGEYFTMLAHRYEATYYTMLDHGQVPLRQPQPSLGH